MSLLAKIKYFPLRLHNKIFPTLRKYRYFLYPNIRLSRGVRLGTHVLLKNWNGGKIEIGERTCIEDNAMIMPMGGYVIIGSDSTVNPFTIIYGQGGCKIGNGVRIAAHCTIIPSNHQYKDYSKPIFKQGLVNKGIVIDDNVWIGTGVRILDGVHIASGCVIGAGSVVTKSTEPNGIYVGVPAKRIRERNGL